MPGAKRVIRAFLPLGKTGDAILHAQAAHRRTPPGQNFVRVRLMADIPHQLVVRCVIHVVQCDAEFHRAQIGRQVAASLAHRLDQKLAHLTRQLRQLIALQLAQIAG